MLPASAPLGSSAALPGSARRSRSLGVESFVAGAPRGAMEKISKPRASVLLLEALKWMLTKIELAMRLATAGRS